MKNIKARILGIGLAAAFGLSACGDGGLGDLKKLRDEACACSDMACATAVTNKLQKMKSVKKKNSDEAKKVIDEMTACLGKAMAPPAPSQ